MIDTNQFGKMPDGQVVDSYILTNKNGMSVEILTLGAIIRSWTLATDPNVDIVLGFDSVDDYLSDQSYLGRTVGRYANRIEKGLFKIAEKQYSVSTNLQGNCLHGGVDGFHNRIWSVSNLLERPDPSITLSLISEDGDQGFPGTLTVDVIFTLDQEDRLTIEYRGLCNQDTVFNPTQHSYFNLAGHDSGGIFDQQITLSANFYTPADENAIPTGEIRSVDNTAFDLRQPTPFGKAIKQQDEEIKAASGLDHNWCVDGFSQDQQKLQLVAQVTEPKSGRTLVTETTMPGAQIYTGNFLGENTLGKNNTKYAAYHGFCIESQFYPNSPNQAAFPSATLLANTPFVSRTSYQVKQKSQQ
ncbi:MULTISPECIES: aldose epimerase family protein [Aliiglaciecola]|uniref:aldose epimerase family protein n=1 Tax=Aliiglaciecola TaxID=1406885 RepID=UPI001C09DA66|nr:MULTISPECIES: aldose epimerase family protein [Aliiglaciecola]MBU2876659.1 galactose mutarotase [Aliiglaciecola lipolytica]MDO6711406.1 aldose epimerase family protein [Aliiglaciecola sp. 2_MG-2023]MDO6752617.1 aldose epimerase family protein [Aliiglaciecola sp. 1_MG-2023]